MTQYCDSSIDIEQIEVPVVVVEESFTPSYASAEAAGADAKAHLSQPVTIPPGSSVLIPTGLKVAIPAGYEIQVRPRSGLALKDQITVLNTPGTIDADYRGEIGVILINHGKKDFIVTPGMRIAQLVLCRVIRAQFVQLETLTVTQRGEGGFGHTGR